MVAVAQAMALEFMLYLVVSVLALYSFGSTISSNMLDNIDSQDNWESYVLRVVFLIVVAFHIPFLFHPTKDSFLQMYFELKTRAISTQMKQNLLE